jgi:hypothetical protein
MSRATGNEFRNGRDQEIVEALTALTWFCYFSAALCGSACQA